MSELSENILRLREEGFSYTAICAELGCSLGTVSYHVGDGQKKKSFDRQNNRRKKNPLVDKIKSFTYRGDRRQTVEKTEYVKSIDSLVKSKTRDFQRRFGSKNLSSAPMLFGVDEILSKYGTETICYLTGKEINLLEPKTYQFDHIIPATKGGSNNIENLGVACKQANIAKSNLSVEEFVSLCREVVQYYDET